MSDAIEAVLRGAGLTDEPGEFDGNIHSWRCEHPNVYGKCDCFQSLVDDLADHDREVAAEALRDAATFLSTPRYISSYNRESPMQRMSKEEIVAHLIARAATYQDKETSDA